MVKLLMGWDIVAGREREYLEFIVRDFEPGLAELGLQVTEIWYTIYGEWPQITMGTVAENLQTAREALSSESWRILRRKLSRYVTGFEKKVIPARGGYQI